MRIRAHKQSQPQQGTALQTSRLTKHTIGNQAAQALPPVHAKGRKVETDTPAPILSGHDFSLIPIRPPAAGVIQTKLAISEPGDEYEQEADRVSELVMRMPEPHLQRACACGGGGSPNCQTPLGHERERVQTKGIRSSDSGLTAAPHIVHEVLRAPGQPLDPATRAFMEPRFGYDFSRVRVHPGTAAELSARDVNAHAYTVGHNIVFGAGRFEPGTHHGRRLLAHELTHVVQQSGAAGTHAGQDNEKRGLSPIHSIGLRHTAPTSIQRQVDFGLATSQNVSGYAAKVKAYKNDKANQSKSFEELTRYAVGVFNDELQAMGIPIVKLEIKPIDTVAHFSYKDWLVRVNRTEFTGKSGPLTIGELTKQQMTDLVESIYHEGRHAEQSYKIAGFLAGQGKSETDIARGANIPEDIAKQAKTKPLAAIDPAIEDFAADLGESLGKRSGDDPKDISKRTQDFRKKVAEHNQEVQQAEDWYQEKPLINLIYDNSYEIRGPLNTIEEEAKKRRKGSWETGKLQPAIDSIKKVVMPQLDTELKRVSAQKNRSEMVNHLVSLKKNFDEMIDLIQKQTNSPTLIIGFEEIEIIAELIPAELKVAYTKLLTEADAYTQAGKVTSAMKRH